MVAIVSVETVLLVVLVILVAGLLRSNAEILRRLGSAGETGPATAEPATGVSATAEPATPVRVAGVPASPVAGPTPGGEALALDFTASGSEPTLLAFLTSGCTTCAGFWETLGEPRLPAGVRTVVVTHGPERERPGKLRKLAPEGVPVIMSSEAWSDYAVPGSPYFVLVQGSIRGEGTASSWTALASLVSDAIEDGVPTGGQARADAAELALAASGIGPEHPSLYPGAGPTRR